MVVHTALNTRKDEIAIYFFFLNAAIFFTGDRGVGVETSLICSLLYLYYATF